MKRELIQAAIAAVLTVGVATSVTSALAGTKNKMEKCYGIAKAGKNACGTATHSCAGQAKTDNDPNEWILVAKGTCKEKGGQLKGADES
jgi:uncharacterized membrane protein